MRDVAQLKRSKVYKRSKLRMVMEDKGVVMVEFENGGEGTGGKIRKVVEGVREKIFR
jgi:hypothetical protein